MVPLSRQTVEALKELHVLTGAYPLLFPGRSDRTKPRSNTVFLMALRRLGYEGRQTGHGFRHIASTALNEHRFDADHIEAQLSHKAPGVRGIYNKAQYLAPRTTMMQWYADYLDGLEKHPALLMGPLEGDSEWGNSNPDVFTYSSAYRGVRLQLDIRSVGGQNTLPNPSQPLLMLLM